MATPTIGWWEVISADKASADKARKFYGEVFGWKVGAADPNFDYSMIDAKQAGVGGGIGSSPQGKGYVTIYVTVDDPDAYLKKAEKAGGKTLMPTTTITPDTTIAQFADPNGAMIGLLKAMPQRATRTRSRPATTRRKSTTKARSSSRSTAASSRARRRR